tara:strand:+ start:583 stop:1458 length:876 start_codon:yes stop_codon:yes gene_type:complete
MTEKRSYSYTVLRYVHDVVSGEALNVGVVLHVPSKGFLKVQTRKTIGRLKQVFPDLDRHDFVEAMRAVDRGLGAIAKRAKGEPLFDGQADARSHALKVLPNDDSALQWSPVGTGLTADPAKTFERLYERYVMQYDRKADRRRSDEDIWRPVREKLAEREVHVPFEPKVVSGTQDQIEFKKAWKNGKWHAYEPVSLDLADADHIKDKARRWRGHLSAVAEGSKDDVELHFVLGRPQNTSLMRAYESAKEILKGARYTSEVVDENDVDDLIATLEDEYRAHLAETDQSPSANG